MNYTFSRNAVLAALLALPLSAGATALSGEAAKAALTAAAGKADRALTELARLPSEFAGLSLAMPYGDEKIIPLDGDYTIDDIKAMLKGKASYWKAVGDALKAEKTRVDREISELSPAEIELLTSMSRESIALGRGLRAASAVRADVAKDIVLVDDLTSGDAQRIEAREKDDSILARKTAVFRELRSLQAP